MDIQHTNRKGDIYYLQAGKTRSGKPRYWFGRKVTGEPVATLPTGFEIYERPETAIVSLRMTRPTAISSLDQDILSNGLRRYASLQHFIVDVDGDTLVVYLPGMDGDEADRLLDVFGRQPLCSLSSTMQSTRDWLICTSNYTKMMRFILVDADERLFAVERWCFRGSIDNWIPVGRRGTLEDLVRKYGQHLGKESFYELI